MGSRYKEGRWNVSNLNSPMSTFSAAFQPGCLIHPARPRETSRKGPWSKESNEKWRENRPQLQNYLYCY